MSLKSIRTSYSKFLNVLDNAGVKLNESQKADLDGFILAIESKMAKQKQMAIKVTKKVVTEHLEKQYKKIFESIMRHQAINAKLSSRIQNKITTIKENKKMATKVDQYLNLYVESVLPKKTIVDYEKMRKLEKLHESLKDILVVDEKAVKAKKRQLAESFYKQKCDLETKMAKLQAKLNNSLSKNLALNNKIDKFKAVELLESKTKDLPDYEAKMVKKRLSGASTGEINCKFKTVLENIKKEIKTEAKEEECSLESEVKDILKKNENDILNNRKHNGHIDQFDKQIFDDQILDDELLIDDATVAEADDEEIKKEAESDEDEVKLAESEIIDQNLMKLWCQQANKIKY